MDGRHFSPPQDYSPADCFLSNGMRQLFRKARRPCPSEETADSGIRGAGGCQKSGAGAET